MKPTGSHSRLPRVYYGAGASAGAVAWQGAWHHVFHALQPRPEGAWPDLHPHPPHKPPHIPQTNLTRRPGTVSRSGRGKIPSPAAAQPFPPVLRPHPERAAPRRGGLHKAERALQMVQDILGKRRRPRARRDGGWGWGAGWGRGGRPGGAPGCGGGGAAWSSGEAPPSPPGPATPAAPRAAGANPGGWREAAAAAAAAAAAPNPSSWAHHLPLTAERGTGRGRRGASRPVSLSHAVLPQPRRRRRRCRRRSCRSGRSPGPELRWAITLFHTRPAHSGNGKERPPSAQAPEERARNPALSPQPAQSQRSLTAQAPNADNEKGLCGGSHPKASPAAYCAGVLQRPAWTMKRTLALAGTATKKDYSSQRAVRQLQVEVSLLGMLGFVVSDAFKL